MVRMTFFEELADAVTLPYVRHSQRYRDNQPAGIATRKFFDCYNRRMRRFLALPLLLMSLPALAQSTNTPDTIIQQENTFWKAYVDGNTADLGRLFLPDFTNVEQNIWNRDQVLAFVKQFHEHCTLAPITILEPHVTFLAADIATVTYHATETPTCGTHTMSGDTKISSVWVRRGGNWQLHLHSEFAVIPCATGSARTTGHTTKTETYKRRLSVKY